MNYYEKAHAIATEAHKEQKRWNGEPYITHPIRVAQLIIKECEGSMNSYRLDLIMAIAILHDVVEDTEITLMDLVGDFPESVVLGVASLTRKNSESYDEFIERCGNGSEDAIKVKIADIEDNLRDLDKVKNRQRYEKYKLSKLYLEKRLEDIEGY